MTFTWDPIYTVNLLLCIIILLLGYWGYNKKEDKTPLYISVAFSLFAISHLATLLSLKEALTTVLIIIRTIAYLTVAFALYKYPKH